MSKSEAQIININKIFLKITLILPASPKCFIFLDIDLVQIFR